MTPWGSDHYIELRKAVHRNFLNIEETSLLFCDTFTQDAADGIWTDASSNILSCINIIGMLSFTNYCLAVKFVREEIWWTTFYRPTCNFTYWQLHAKGMIMISYLYTPGLLRWMMAQKMNRFLNELMLWSWARQSNISVYFL